MTSNTPRFIFVPDPKNDEQLVWNKNAKREADSRIYLSDEGFIFTDINTGIAELIFEKIE